MSKKTTKLWWYGIVVLVIAAIVGIRLSGHAQAETKEQRLIPVITTTVKLEDGYFAKRSFTGRAVTGRISNIAFELSGTLKKVYVDTGSKVKAGDAIASLDTARLEANRKQLLAQKHEIASNFELSKRTFDRIAATYKQGHVSAQRLDEAEANLIAMKAGLERLDASIDALDVDLEKAHIRAPFDGVITNRMLDEGTVVTPASPIIELTETSHMEAHIGLPQSYALAIQKGAPFELRDGKRNIIYGATLRSVVPTIEGQTRTMMVILDLPAGLIARGELISIVINDWQEDSGAWLPLRALSSDVRGMWRVYKVITTTNTPAYVEFENVQILYSEANRAFVTGTITNDDLIIADGISRLAPGQYVTISARSEKP
ncbi:efflux RND transporter periplasmic adaptor subunit [Kordiimonas pumila]|uniref:Efflux RND transporter periplasmic adaptor subunit n=1 Tax=Kordiimonas pumila TaxID=2161677 RepID=A0ABV7D821_9PROT|nr:efflux RND transporter periplasmic adaptor subunit [Kordiimonas pumila]